MERTGFFRGFHLNHKSIDIVLRLRKVMSRANTMARTVALNRVARVLSGELENVGTPVKRVIVCPQNRACTDGETVWIPETMNENQAINRMMQEAVLAHEAAGHLRYTDFGAWKVIGDKIKAGTEDRLLHDIVNILEDARVNHLLAQDFAGSGKRLDATQAMFMDKHKEQWAAMPTEAIVPAKAAIIAMMTEAIAHEPHFFPHVEEVVEFMDEVRDQMVKAISQPNTKTVVKSARMVLKAYRARWNESASDDNTGVPSSEEGEGMMLDDMSPEQIERMANEQKKREAKVEEVARSRFDELKKKMDEVKKEAKKQSEDASKGEESSDAPQGGEESEDAPEGEGNESNGEGDQEGGDAGDSESSEGESSEGGSPTEGEGEGDSQGEGEGDSAGESSDGESSDGAGDEEGEGESDAGNNTSGESGSKGKVAGDFEELFSELEALIEAEELEALKIEKNDEKMVSDATSDDIGGEEYSGMVDGVNHYDCKVDVSHTTQEMLDRYPEKIEEFAHQYSATAKANNTEITTLVNEMKRLLKDPAGKFQRSLKKGKVDARRLAYSTGSDRVFKKRNEESVAKVNVVVMIDASGSMGRHRSNSASEAATVLAEAMNKLKWNCEVVDFNSGSYDTAIRVRKSMKAPLNQLTKAAIRMPFVGSCNGDGYAVEWALNRLQQFDGHRMLFVISDGQPSGPAPKNMDEDQHLIHVVSNAPKNIGLFSIGIDGMDTSEYYPHSVSCNASGLAKAVIPVLRTMVRQIKRSA